MSHPLFIASGNIHKAEEFAALLDGLGFLVSSANTCGGMPSVKENGSTFEENARLKALALKSLVPRGASVLADDSGLEVDALEGAPGIYSARYAGINASDQTNLEKLLIDLCGVSNSERAARFRCALCFIDSIGNERFFFGSCYGTIAQSATGSEGFGYDPVFIPDGYSKSFGELGESVKSQLSHRALAVQALRTYLSEEDSLS